MIKIHVPELIIDDVITLPAHTVEGEPGFIKAVCEILSDPELNEKLKHSKYLCCVLSEIEYGETDFYEKALHHISMWYSLDGYVRELLEDNKTHPLNHLLADNWMAETQEMRDLRIQWARHTAKHIKLSKVF